VILVYLGFLNADEMTDIGAPLTTHSEWEYIVRSHSETLFPGAVLQHRELVKVPKFNYISILNTHLMEEQTQNQHYVHEFWFNTCKR
jgi:hypothetical protein